MDPSDVVNSAVYLDRSDASWGQSVDPEILGKGDGRMFITGPLKRPQTMRSWDLIPCAGTLGKPAVEAQLSKNDLGLKAVLN